MGGGGVCLRFSSSKPYPMFKDFSQKSDLLERHTPVCLTPRVPPPPPPGWGTWLTRNKFFLMPTDDTLVEEIHSGQNYLLRGFPVQRESRTPGPLTTSQHGQLYNGGSKGGAAVPPPPKIRSTVFFKILFCIRMLKNKVQTARNRIKTRELPGPLSEPWTPTGRDIGLRAHDVCTHILCSPPPPPHPMKIQDPPLLYPHNAPTSVMLQCINECEKQK